MFDQFTKDVQMPSFCSKLLLDIDKLRSFQTAIDFSNFHLCFCFAFYDLILIFKIIIIKKSSTLMFVMFLLVMVPLHKP